MVFKRARNAADADAAEVVKRRKFYTIAKDQQKILNRGNVSYNHIKTLPGGIQGNVPPAVLHGLEARYRRNKDTLDGTTKEHRPRSPSSDGPNQTKSTPWKTRNRSQQDSTESSNLQNLQSPEPDCSPGVIQDWPTSPPSPRRRAAKPDPSQRVEETPAIQHSTRRTFQRDVLSQRPVPSYNFPSSDGADEELEVDIPDMEEVFAPNVNATGMFPRHLALSPGKAASSMQNTPPCAQPSPAVVPSTLILEKQSTKAYPTHNQFKPLDWDAGNALSRPNKATIGASKACPQSQKSDEVESSLIIPATLEPAQERAHLRLRSPVRKESKQSVDACLFFTAPKAAHGQGERRRSEIPQPTQDDSQQPVREQDVTYGARESVGWAAESAQPPSSTRHVHSQSPPERQVESVHNWSQEDDSRNQTMGSVLSSAAMPTSLDEEHDPYRHFTMVYPAYEQSYNGSLLYFVRAAAVLQHLRSELSLKSALYDDFIRAFAGGYMSYAKAAGPDRECMPAFEWYNWKDEDILFNRGVLKQGNLDLIKQAYPEEFKQARQLFSGDAQDAQRDEGMEDVRETIEMITTEEADHGADLADNDAFKDGAEVQDEAEAELGEPDLPSRTNGAYLIVPQPVTKAANTQPAERNTPVADNHVSEETAWISQRGRRHQTPPDVDTGKSSIRQRKLSEQLGISPQRLISGSPVVDLTSHQASPDVEPPAVPPHARAAASIASAHPSPQAEQNSRVVSAPMPPPRPTSRLESNAPPSSSSVSRRVSSSAGPTASNKPRPSGMSYLQRLKLKGGGDQSRGARMRELGRAKRLSSGASVASSHASSK